MVDEDPYLIPQKSDALGYLGPGAPDSKVICSETDAILKSGVAIRRVKMNGHETTNGDDLSNDDSLVARCASP